MSARDFTTSKYLELIAALHDAAPRYAMMHDVDARPDYALRLAQAESEFGLHSTYYFRRKHFASHADVIKNIAALGHTVGYHYEDLATCHGNMASAFAQFQDNLSQLRQLAPVSTACAHGSPTSRWNNHCIWNQHDIHALGIAFEPLLDTDFSRTLYLTDTGRRWDGHRVSIRDKVPQQHDRWAAEGLLFHTTDDIIHALNQIGHPIHSHALLINTHPQRWTSAPLPWAWEWASQRMKNTAKRILLCFNS